MEDQTKRKLVATGKVVGGALRVASGVATGIGVGLVGRYLKVRHMQKPAGAIGWFSIAGGAKMLSSGWKELMG
ncbi:MAG TPA: hypothetical protein VHQ47_06160 [Phycisphaerae bacterium]|jgi:hypothetical protein|nr:hypothetical protein [Phycisphaerae bacterium]